MSERMNYMTNLFVSTPMPPSNSSGKTTELKFCGRGYEGEGGLHRHTNH